MPKIPERNQPNYKIGGGQLNTHEFNQMHGQLTQEEQQPFMPPPETPGGEPAASPQEAEAQRIAQVMELAREEAARRRRTGATVSGVHPSGEDAGGSTKGASGAKKSAGTKKGASTKRAGASAKAGAKKATAKKGAAKKGGAAKKVAGESAGKGTRGAAAKGAGARGGAKKAAASKSGAARAAGKKVGGGKRAAKRGGRK